MIKIPGFLASGTSSGIKQNGKLDIGLIFSKKPAKAAAVFTQNVVKAAPVYLGMERIGSNRCQAIVVNSGNANACTGSTGMDNAREMSLLTARELNIDESLVIPSSTGVIGVQLPMELIRNSIPKLASSLSEEGFELFAESIMTTDAFSKTAIKKLTIDGKEGTIAVIGKGAGMIEPNMATMLAFILTDIDIDNNAPYQTLKTSVDGSYNRIIVDGDTSTNDSAFLLSSGELGNEPLKPGSKDYDNFLAALTEVNTEVAEMIVRDGEGATKVVRIVVTGAKTQVDAEKIARRMGNSLLVKTALYGEDANWGRFLSSAGAAGVDFDPEIVDLDFDGHYALKDGSPVGDEQETSEVFKRPSFTVTLDIKLGTESSFVTASDITLDYIKLNAHYRT